MKKLPRTDVIEKQVVVTLQEQTPGRKITADDLDAVQGGLARPIYGVPLPFPKPDKPGVPWLSPWPNPKPPSPGPTFPGPRIPGIPPGFPWPKPWKT